MCRAALLLPCTFYFFTSTRRTVNQLNPRTLRNSLPSVHLLFCVSHDNRYISFIVYIYWISIASRKNESLFAHRIIGLNCFQLICRNESHRITIHGHFNIHRVRLLIKFFQNLWASGKQLCFSKTFRLSCLMALLTKSSINIRTS